MHLSCTKEHLHLIEIIVFEVSHCIDSSDWLKNTFMCAQTHTHTHSQSAHILMETPGRGPSTSSSRGSLSTSGSCSTLGMLGVESMLPWQQATAQQTSLRSVHFFLFLDLSVCEHMRIPKATFLTARTFTRTQEHLKELFHSRNYGQNFQKTASLGWIISQDSGLGAAVLTICEYTEKLSCLFFFICAVRQVALWDGQTMWTDGLMTRCQPCYVYMQRMKCCHSKRERFRRY